jgi:outer membrane protein assembly factor BamB
MTGHEPKRFIVAAFVVAAGVLLLCQVASAGDWPQWGGGDSKNMAANERDLPESFVPGKKDSRAGTVKIETATNVRWARKVCQSTYSSPVVAGGKVFLCGNDDGGVIACMDEATGKMLWRWKGGSEAHHFGICSSPVVEGDRLYVVNQDSVAMCLDVNGDPKARSARETGLRRPVPSDSPMTNSMP